MRRLAAVVLCVCAVAWAGSALVPMSGRWLRLPLAQVGDRPDGLKGPDAFDAAQGAQPDVQRADAPVQPLGSPDPAGSPMPSPTSSVTPRHTAAGAPFRTWAEARAAMAAAGTHVERARVAAVWTDRLRQSSAPWEEGRRTYFFYYGAARRVGLAGDFNAWQESPMERLPGTDLWVTDLALPRNAILAYRLQVDGRSMLDPLNKEQTWALGNSFSVYLGPAVRVDRITPDPPRAAPPGRMEELRIPSRHLDRTIRVLVYLPPECTRGHPCQAVYLFDGPFFLDQGRLAQTVAARTQSGELAPTALVAVDPGEDPLRRVLDLLPGLGRSRDTAAFVAEELVPKVEEQFPIRSGRKYRAVMGMSAGGAAALQTVLLHPDLFGRALVQSPVVLPLLRQLVAEYRGKKPVIYMSWGQFEQNVFGFHVAEEAEQLVRLLAESRFPLRTRSAPAGHNMVFWRRDAGPALVWLWNQPLP